MNVIMIKYNIRILLSITRIDSRMLEVKSEFKKVALKLHGAIVHDKKRHYRTKTQNNYSSDVR